MIFGGRIGAGVFGQSVLMSAAMQVLAAKMLGIENLVLTGQKGGKNAGIVANIYQEAITKVDEFVTKHNIEGMKIEKMLSIFLDEVKHDAKWEKNSTYK